MIPETAWIAKQARALGFAQCGVVRLELFAELEQFREWLERGYGGEMRYLEDEKRRNPQSVMEGARSAIVCTLNYNTKYPYSTVAAAQPRAGDPRGWISRYAWGGDYHEVFWEKLNALDAALHANCAEPFKSRAYADTGPLAERVLAKHAGLGWIGKNTLLLNEQQGSWFFLGVIVTTLELEPTLGRAELPPADLCGNCRQCLDACPTGALVEPYVMDARRCISYLTIELRGNIPEELRAQMGWQVYGCDICQDVCPYNERAPFTEIARFEPRRVSKGELLHRPSLLWLANLKEEEFREAFRGSAIKRTKCAGMVRNACVALGNVKLPPGTAEREEAVRVLSKLSGSTNPAIAESAQWALSRIQETGDQSRQPLPLGEAGLVE